MTVRSMGDKVPVVAPTAWVSEAAYVVGDVHLADHASVWPGAVVRGDVGSIRIGAYTVIEDNCVVHSGGATTVGEDNIIGHGVVLHCARVGSSCLIGNHATLLDDAEIGDHCLVAAGSLVPARLVVPDRSFVSGSPATVEPISDRHLQRLLAFSTTGREQGYPMMAARYRDAGL
jgi:carbonic anhydrase/acetyltransferase-like protein (isoleucine patch superfamily)